MLFLSEKSRNVVGKDVVVRKRKHLQTCCVKPDKESQAKREIDNVLSTETVRLVLELDTDLVVVPLSYQFGISVIGSCCCV